MHLNVQGLTKTFGQFTALNDVSIKVASQEFVCLLGPSGCGKTTLLRIIAGLDNANTGSIDLNGENLAGLHARERGFGIVFQSYSLFPNMTIAENIGYGLKIRSIPKADVEKRVKELLETIKLPDVAHRYPWELSGGQQQRVALARAIAVNPRLLLLDEPLSALDAKVRAELRTEIRALQRSLGIPTLMVTHDQEEALMLADRIICMNNGHVEQSGTPEDLYLRPETRFVADFMGINNLMTTAYVRDHLPHLLNHRPTGTDQDYLASVRPEQISAIDNPNGNATVKDISFLGNISRMLVDSPTGELTIETHGNLKFIIGQKIHIEVRPEDCSWVNNTTTGGIRS